VDNSATATYCFATSTDRPLQVTFDGGLLTSDGGLPWLVEAETALGICKAFAACLTDWRKDPARSRHSLEMLVRQRVLQMACGYSDQDDADSLRSDPLFKLACGQLPSSGHDLASQPTLSRLENSVDRHACTRLALALVALYLEQRAKDGVPKRILLDLDATDDPTHGEQEGSSYHGYYRQHQYLPLLIFDGETQALITAVLRPGTVHASRLAVPVLRRLVALLRARFPDVSIEIRADSGFAVPRLYTFCEQERITYTLGIATNPRLEAKATLLKIGAELQRKVSKAEKVRLAGETSYQAGSWDHPRRVVFKAESLAKGPNVRFVVTTRQDPPLELYDWYVDRGTPEQWIDQLKATCFADRLSDHRFYANQFRLLLSAVCYWLLHTIRGWLLKQGLSLMRMETLRLTLLKIGGRVFEFTDHCRLRLASSNPSQPLWLLLARRSPLMNNPG
jgi:Transposase DDE domain group 1